MGSLQQGTLILHQHPHPATAFPRSGHRGSALHTLTLLRIPLRPALCLQLLCKRQAGRRKRNEGCARQELLPAGGTRAPWAQGHWLANLALGELHCPPMSSPHLGETAMPGIHGLLCVCHHAHDSHVSGLAVEVLRDTAPLPGLTLAHQNRLYPYHSTPRLSDGLPPGIQLGTTLHPSTWRSFSLCLLALPRHYFKP